MSHDIAELLPFYLNGTLEPAEKARVETELPTCESCRAELAELRDIAGVLRARAAAMPAPPAQLLERARARIATPPMLSAARVRSAWWGTVARYAAAVVLVASVSAGAVAAWHAHEAGVARDGTATTTGSGDSQGTLVYRVSPGPRAARVAPLAAVGQSVARAHRLERSAQLMLDVDDLRVALAQAGDIVPILGAVVEGPHLVGTGIQVPAARLDDVLDRLSTVGTVTRRTVQTIDLEPVLAADAARLLKARREANALHALSTTVTQADPKVLARVQDAVARVSQDDAKLRRDEARVGTATIVLMLTQRS